MSTPDLQEMAERLARYELALQTIAALQGYTGADQGRVAGYRVAANIADKALFSEKMRESSAVLKAEQLTLGVITDV